MNWFSLTLLTVLCGLVSWIMGWRTPEGLAALLGLACVLIWLALGAWMERRRSADDSAPAPMDREWVDPDTAHPRWLTQCGWCGNYKLPSGWLYLPKAPTHYTITTGICPCCQAAQMSDLDAQCPPQFTNQNPQPKEIHA